MSLRELASALNYDQSSLSKIERNELTAPVELVRPMAEKLMDLKIQLEEMLDV
ncbi:MAG: helix-turn-helix transcriptional regulator [Saprospirales bacterium]|nr:helix-turn-helix transcriptional regulator [Saprospirales bacterium]